MPVSQDSRSVGPEVAQSYAGLSAIVDTVDLPDASICLGKDVILNIIGPVSATTFTSLSYWAENTLATLYTT